MSLRVGLGFDVHPFVADKACVLGGVTIPHTAGPAGHSDGDALLHAITDAVLGAAGLDDIGTLFPDTDEAWKGADSRDLLRRALEEVRRAGFRVVNVDTVLVTDAPRIAPHRAAMRATLAGLLGIDAVSVNVKGKTTEGLGALAGGRGVAAQAVCLLESLE